MDLIVLVLVLVLIGFLVWVLTTYVPLPPKWKEAIQVISLVIMVIYVITRVLHVPNVLH